MNLNEIVIGEGPRKVVFLHGLFGQGKNFSSIATSLGDIATSHLVDLPNHGLSPWTQEFDLDEQADIIADWISAMIREPVSLIGHSLGGKIAMRLALRHPDLIERLMVVDVSPVRNDAAMSFATLVAAMRNLDIDHLASRTEADRLISEDVPDRGVRQFLLQNLRRRGAHWHWAANLDLLGDSLHQVGGWVPTDAVYPGPVFWVTGGRSPYVLPEHAAAMRELFPRVAQLTLKRAGHWVHADDPEAFLVVCRRFLTGED